MAKLGSLWSRGWLALVLSTGVGGCGREQSSYDRLCRLYEKFDGQPTTSELAVEISKQVGSELPQIYADYHVVMTSASEGRYEMFKMLARERARKSDWSCDAIYRRYPPAVRSR